MKKSDQFPDTSKTSLETPLHLTTCVINDWGLSCRNILVRVTLSLPISFLLGLCVNMVMLFIWMLLLCTYTSWMQYKRQLRNYVRLHIHPCYLVAKPVPLACCASCWIFIVGHHFWCFALPLSLSHIPAVCDMSMMILCCRRVL